MKTMLTLGVVLPSFTELFCFYSQPVSMASSIVVLMTNPVFTEFCRVIVPSQPRFVRWNPHCTEFYRVFLWDPHPFALPGFYRVFFSFFSFLRNDSATERSHCIEFYRVFFLIFVVVVVSSSVGESPFPPESFTEFFFLIRSDLSFWSVAYD